MTYEATILAEPSLVAFVPCYETVGPNKDIVVGDNNTTTGSAPTYGVVTTSLLGSFGTQLNSAGVMLWTNPLFGAPATDFSVEAWFNVAVPSSGALVYGDLPGPANDFGLQVTGNAQPRWSIGNPDGACIITGPSTYSDGQWHHVVGTYQEVSGVANLYIDGVFVGTATTPNPGGKNGSSTFRAGMDNTTGWSGVICNLAIYNSALTLTQVQTHYNAGTVQPPPPITLFGGFAPDQVFKPVMLVNVAGIKPRVYVPIQNNTVRTKQ